MLHTVAGKVHFTGVGLHSGETVKMTLSPAPAGSGVNFRRVDVDPAHQLIAARYDRVTDTMLCTKLSNDHGVSVGTVEHVLAAIAGCGVNDVLITLDGPEVPIMDGSSAAFVEGIVNAGVEVRDAPCKAIRILRPVAVENDGKRAELHPADRFSMSFSISFADPAIGDQALSATLVNGAFVEELSDSRTFGHLSEVEHLRKIGLARGGSLENAIVVNDGVILNKEGLRQPDEFVRHKMLDAVGDLFLAGSPIIGAYRGVKAGHDMTNRLLHRLFDEPDAWEWTDLAPDQRLGWGIVPVSNAGDGRASLAV